MDLTERQKRNLLLLLCVFFGSMGLIANDLLSGGRIDRVWILFAVVCLGATIEILVRSGTNHPTVTPPHVYRRAAITVVLIAVVEVVVSLIVRVTLNVPSDTAKLVVFGGAVAIGAPALLIIVAGGRRTEGQSGP